MVEEIQMYLKSLNFGYRTALREKGITYVNSYATFKESNKLEVNKYTNNKKVIQGLGTYYFKLYSDSNKVICWSCPKQQNIIPGTIPDGCF